MEQEVEDLIDRFTLELRKVLVDGSNKRQAGKKLPWWESTSHKPAIFSHLTKYEKGEKIDPDSGAHPFVHLACRALMIACKETGNYPPRKPNHLVYEDNK